MKRTTLTRLFLAGSSLLFPLIALAFDFDNPGIPATVTIKGVVADVLKVLWIAILVISSILAVGAGILFATSAGDPEKVGKARNIIVFAVVGILVGILGFSFTGILQNILTSF